MSSLCCVCCANAFMPCLQAVHHQQMPPPQGAGLEEGQAKGEQGTLCCSVLSAARLNVQLLCCRASFSKHAVITSFHAFVACNNLYLCPPNKHNTNTRRSVRRPLRSTAPWSSSSNSRRTTPLSRERACQQRRQRTGQQTQQQQPTGLLLRTVLVMRQRPTSPRPRHQRSS